MKVRPIGGKVLVRLHNVEEKTKSGIFIASTDKGSVKQAEVIAVGPGKILESGARAAMHVNVGDRVYFKKGYESEEIMIEGENLLMVEEKDILAVIE